MHHQRLSSNVGILSLYTIDSTPACNSCLRASLTHENPPWISQLLMKFCVSPSGSNSQDVSSPPSRALTQLMLPRSVLISPLCPNMRIGWARGHLGMVFVLRRVMHHHHQQQRENNTDSNKMRGKKTCLSVMVRDARARIITFSEAVAESAGWSGVYKVWMMDLCGACAGDESKSQGRMMLVRIWRGERKKNEEEKTGLQLTTALNSP